MKTNLIATIALFALLISFFMETSAQQGVKVGFRVSPLVSVAASVVNDSTKQIPEGLSTKPASSFGAGLMFDFSAGKTVGLSTGINYVTRSFTTTQQTADPTSSTGAILELMATQKIQSIEVPIGLKLRSPEIGTGISLFLALGVNAEFNFGSYESLDSLSILRDPAGGGFQTQVTAIERDDIAGLQSFTTSFVPGAGVDWEFDWGTVTTGVSYHWGLMNIIDKGSTTQGTRTKISYVALDLGYYF